MGDEVQVTMLLSRAAGGDEKAVDELFPMVYEELHRRAQQYMRSERANHTLQPTALVSEVYLKMVGGAQQSWENRGHFYYCAARAMRQLLIDYSRAKKSRGGQLKHVDLDNAAPATENDAGEMDWEALDQALETLRQDDHRRYQVVMYRYFAGLPEQQIAELLGVSTKTVERDWEKARMYLYAHLNPKS
jgi:RNA polymerase sigma factor (TIGR02999 family)